MGVVLEAVYAGKFVRISALVIDGESPAREYLQASATRPDFGVLMARIRMVADNQNLRNEDIFKRKGDGIYEFRTKKGLRLYAFYDGPDLIIAAYGNNKPGRERQTRDIAQAEKWRRKYFEAKR